ncbi:hypothetical protein SESBI_35224 [Sesbania bispinosa]|nr:hypothetical protein SESBI_35224 [Sesbania bispinosa]
MRYSYFRNLCTGFRSRSATKLNTSNPHSSYSSTSSFPTLSSLKLVDSGDSPDAALKEISSIFYGSQSVKRPDSEEIDGANEFERIPNISWLSNISQSNIIARETF